MSSINPNLNVPELFPIMIPSMSLILKFVLKSDCITSLVRFALREARTRRRFRFA